MFSMVGVYVSTRCHRKGRRDLSTTPSPAPSHPVPNPGLSHGRDGRIHPVWTDGRDFQPGLSGSTNVRQRQEAMAECAKDAGGADH